MDTYDHVNNSFIMVADTHNIDLYILFCKLSLILVEIYVKIGFFNNGGNNLHNNYTWDILLTC